MSCVLPAIGNRVLQFFSYGSPNGSPKQEIRLYQCVKGDKIACKEHSSGMLVEPGAKLVSIPSLVPKQLDPLVLAVKMF